MKRKDFIVLSFYSGLAVSIPFLGCNRRTTVANKPWVVPDLLSHICDVKTLREIGTNYRQKYPGESNEEQLASLLLTDSDHKIIPINTEDALIRSSLEKKIKKDFEVGNTVVIKGWVLSKTEAQQCALFSFSKN
jgi:hypothetical protein